MTADLAVVYRSPDAVPAAHSGSVAGVARGFSELGLRVALVNAQPPPMAVRLLGALQGPVRQPYARRAATLAPVWRRLRERRVASLPTLVMISDAGLPGPGPVVTFEDMTVAQAQRHPDYLKPFGTRVDDLAGWRERQERLYRHAIGCCLGSAWAAQSVRQDYGVPARNVHIVGRGHSHNVEQPTRDWSIPRFLFVGRDWRRKNGDAVVRSFLRLREYIPSAQLHLVGGHPRIDAAGVRLHGTLQLDRADDRQRLYALYRNSTCFVMPSLVEAFGISYVEAGSFGLPSVGTAVGGASTAIGPAGGVLVDPHDEGEILRALQQLAVPDTAARMGSAAAIRAEMFTWRKVAERLACILLPAAFSLSASLDLGS